MRSQHKSIELYVNFQQFYLWDRRMDPRVPEDYSDEDLQVRLKTGRHLLIVLPERCTTVPVELEIHDAEPPCDADRWDHIAEASLHLPSGELQVHECTGGPVADFSVEPGWYRVRSHHGGLDTIDDVGVAGDDHYLVVLWPAPPAERRVIKQWDHELP